MQCGFAASQLTVLLVTTHTGQLAVNVPCCNKKPSLCFRMDKQTTVSMQDFIAIRNKIIYKRQHCCGKGNNQTLYLQNVIGHSEQFRIYTDGVLFECRLCIHTHTYIHIYIHTYIHTHIHTHIHIHTYIHT